MSTPPPPPNWQELEDAFINGDIGYDIMRRELRSPEQDEYITETGEIGAMFDRIRTAKRKRPLPKLDNLSSIRDELGKLYADVHHGRISSTDFTKRAYVLSLLAQILRMADKATPHLAEAAATS